ncbi:MAG: hypothetical protein KatS3mg108_1768 [Isosphaeraceae bacterium]|jgi:ABC-type multidrug transport system fused ATPase/permease subunit|nr:MAG: hypothetical protein KatS3mg108_1768 [Isosphaeraceae bacterium]
MNQDTKPVEPTAPPRDRDPAWYQLPEQIPPEFSRLAAERDRLEQERDRRYASRIRAAEAEYRQQMAAARSRFQSEQVAIEQFAEASLRDLTAACSQAIQTAQADLKARKEELIRQTQQAIEEARSAREQGRWEAETLFESSERAERERFESLDKALVTELEELDALDAAALAQRDRLRGFGPFPEPEPVPPPGPADLEDLRAALAVAQQRWLAIEAMRLPKIVDWSGLAVLGAAALVVLIGPALWFLGWPAGAGAAVGGALGVVALAAILLRGRARRALRAAIPQLDRDRIQLRGQLTASIAENRRISQERIERLRQKRDQEIRELEERVRQRVQAAEAARDAGLAELEASARQRIERAEQVKAQATEQRTRELTQRKDQLQRWFEQETQRIEHQLRTHHAEAEARRGQDWDELVATWTGGLERLDTLAARVVAEVQARSWDWEQPAEVPPLPEDVPPAIRFGTVRIDPRLVPHGISRDERLQETARGGWELPALLTFPDRASLVVRAGGAGKEEGVAVLQGTMLRWLTSLPPGKVRFTLIDPVGLGRHFAAFMHLADYSELLVTSRIWTEPQQIEQRLADLSLHMEHVIQQFLRNEYANLEEYNRDAGVVAEPYRVLVISHFPAGFHESSAQRLASIAAGGSRCGVHLLILVDEDQPLPRTISVAELSQQAQRLVWRADESRFVWDHPRFASFAFTPDRPPPDERLTPILHRFGEAARRAGRVEVPFDVVAPPTERWWTGDTREGIDVPLGRSGATRLQALQLGRGTSQHALIAGRTGSGKSTLLHALITNAALIYGPDQLEFYLIDFKKGVEFKTYAEHELPHARVIAIESEREFGVSVLQRLDEELRRRGELFRAHNVPDLAAYRAIPQAPPLPRVLLIVDEFQEFFVDDDRLAQEAALLLDRLVRQGRAFGIHVLLGSQTLGGAFSLARSTLGQMGVRIALQCSESDAHLILSEENAAARLLTRPGEAIYNDANGMVEGNHVFQVVWLPESQRAEYLERLRQFDAAQGARPARPRIVFEGNVPSDIRRLASLRALLDADTWPEPPPRAPLAWLGEAVAIKDPTAAVFRRQGGHNLLLVGQDADAARGIFAAALLSLAAQLPPEAASFAILDATPEDHPDEARLRRIAACVPHPSLLGGPSQVDSILQQLADELARRQSHPLVRNSWFVFLFDASRFRQLRRSDDFSFGRADQTHRGEQLAELLREGPALGIHLIIWSDTLNNLQRVFDRSSLREFEMRVLFQMSANDSTNLLDTPLANRLGPHRALFASEDRGTLEKFRPYQLPDQAWLDSIQSQLSGRIQARPAPSAPTYSSGELDGPENRSTTPSQPHKHSS